MSRLSVILVQMQGWLPWIVIAVMIVAALVAAVAGAMVLLHVARRTPLSPQLQKPLDNVLPISGEPDAEEMQEAAEAPNDDQAASPERRSFLIKMIAGLSGVGAALVGVPVIGYLFAPIRRDPPGLWRTVGTVDEFPVGETVQVNYLEPEPLEWAGFSAETAAWLRRTGEQEFEAFSSYCTHVGCPVRWEAGAQMFMCPCHGGAFFANGSPAAGPPPRPLTRYETRIVNGQVEIQTAPVPRADPDTNI